MNRPLSRLELDGIERLLAQEAIDSNTQIEMLAALGRAVAEIREHRAQSRPVAKAALKWRETKRGGSWLVGADADLARVIDDAAKAGK